MSVTHITSQNFEAEVLNSSVPVLVDFWADWCGPCRMIAPIVEEIAAENPDTVKVCKVNVDEEGKLAEKFNVLHIPTILVFKNGKLTEESVGLKSKNDLLAML